MNYNTGIPNQFEHNCACAYVKCKNNAKCKTLNMVFQKSATQVQLFDSGMQHKSNFVIKLQIPRVNFCPTIQGYS